MSAFPVFGSYVSMRENDIRGSIEGKLDTIEEPFSLLAAIMWKWSILLLLGVLMSSACQGYVAYWNFKGPRATYLISKDPEPFDLAKMNSRCKDSGGYLVEINSRSEQGNLKKKCYPRPV
ncbi:hypothetical protein PoB_000040200 [Plakobranchus ocellatus]|uniref:Uncharacterized protein n=1 Tax=Plakobranchus ocellatus TaxID=259542 RepID=A0AAV3XVL3_9GAST|nr:hypothetical protein PoB_000040200 [Plakobranchus ocellatus]